MLYLLIISNNDKSIIMRRGQLNFIFSQSWVQLESELAAIPFIDKGTLQSEMSLHGFIIKGDVTYDPFNPLHGEIGPDEIKEKILAHYGGRDLDISEYHWKDIYDRFHEKKGHTGFVMIIMDILP